MVMTCSAYGCTNRFSKEKNIQFHRYPLHKPELLSKWLIAVRRASWKPTRYSYLCSMHFSPDSYKSDARRYLKDDAVPTLFNFPERLRKKKTVSKGKKIKCPLPPTIITLSTEHLSGNEINCNGPKDDVQNMFRNSDANDAETITNKSTEHLSEDEISCSDLQDSHMFENDDNEEYQIITVNRITESTEHLSDDEINYSDLQDNILFGNNDTDAQTITNKSAEYLSDNETSCDGLQDSQMLENDDKKITSPNTVDDSKPFKTVLCEQCLSSFEVRPESPTKSYLRHKVKLLQQKLNRRDKKIKLLEMMLKKAIDMWHS